MSNSIKDINYKDLNKRAKGISAYKLANRTDLTPNTIYKTLGHKRGMKVSTFIKLLNALNYDESNLKNAFIFNK